MKLFFTFILLTIFQANMTANEIDKLKTDDDVETFLHKDNKKLKNFYLHSLDQIYPEKAQRKSADSLNVKTWQKADFDNNGLTDLLIFNYEYFFVVLDFGKKYEYHSLIKDQFHLNNSNTFPVIEDINKQTVILIHRQKEFDIDNAQTTKTDTLIYKFNSFIEPKNNSHFYKIEKIEYSTTTCLGTCPEFKIEINSDRNAIFDAIQFNKKRGKYRTTIDNKTYAKIINLLNYIDFPKLKDNYQIYWTDNPSCTLTITYDNGEKKTIFDYGLVGTYGLKRFYNEMFGLRKNQKWKKIKTIN